MNKEFVIREPRFYCYQDEKHFFGWLESISGVQSVQGCASGLSIKFTDTGLDQDGWADLIGLMTRYGVDIRGLRDLVTLENEPWLKNPERYWYPMIFDDGIQNS